MKITIVGTGYVGTSNAILLATQHEVTALDIDQVKIDKLNSKKSPIKDEDIEKYLKTKKLNLVATLDWKFALSSAEYILIATPTNYDANTNYFNTSSVEDIIAKTRLVNKSADIIIKSTVPVGFTQSMREKYQTDKIIFSPEFLREGRALYDNLNPSRIIVGERSKKGEEIGRLLSNAAEKENIDILLTDSTEAEAIKLFANTYLAMRVAFFNELDSYAEIKNLDAFQIIQGISLDPRIGKHYNNPSFGYGGYCLPKDTKQLLANYADVPNELISAIVKSNQTRKEHITQMILQKTPKTVGIYRLAMKMGSDNSRESSTYDIIDLLLLNSISVIIYEPFIIDLKQLLENCTITNDLSYLKNNSDLILANRLSDDLKDISNKVYSRDLFSRD